MNRATFTLVTGAALAAPTIASAQADSATVRVGCFLAESSALAIYAKEQGFLKQVGSNVELTLFPASSAITAGVLGGSLDIGCSNLGSISHAHVNGLPLSVIFPGSMYTSAAPTTLLCVSKTSPIQTAKDLNGKTIAVSTIRDTQQASVMKWSDLNGGDSKTLKFIEFAPSEMGKTVAAERVDAAVILEPALSSALKTDVRPLAKPYDTTSPMMITAYYGSNDFLSKNPVAAKKFIAGLKLAAAWANANKVATATILEKYTKIPAAQIMQMSRVVFPETLDPASIQPQIDVLADYKFLPARFPAKLTFWSQA